MESGNGCASSKGVLVSASTGSEAYQNNVLAPLKSAYLYEESELSFKYTSAFFIKNPALENKYNDFRANRRRAGYSEEDLKESYGFLLFDDAGRSHALGETGVLTGNSTCRTLGDPSKGVYISMYSDCLDPNRWYHGKSGYIAIVRLTTGKVKKVIENYTQNFTAPTVGFDCHVSEQLPSVSAKTSSFLAFERTQYYMYELLDDGSNETAQSPSAACPFAIVSFSYTDTKAPQDTSEEKKIVCQYFPWRGQLHIGTHSYDVGLRSTAAGSIPTELPPVVKVDRAVSMSDLKQLLPRAVFETCLSGEVFLDGLYCTVCEFVPSEMEQTSSLSLLLREIKDKVVALTVLLKDGGFLILLHSSHFLKYDDTGSSAAEILQGVFVFPHSRFVLKDTTSGQRNAAMSSEILRVLPVLSYAEGEVEKTSIDHNEKLCDVFVQHMQNYAALISPGLASSPSRELNILPVQYDVPNAHKHLYSSPEWTNSAWQNLRTYLSKPVSFQLPVSMASEILVVEQERIEDLDDDDYLYLSSPEEAMASHVGIGADKSVVNVETSVDRCIRGDEAQGDQTALPQNVAPNDLQPGDATGKPDPIDDLPAELIVSFTSAEPTVTHASVISTESETKHEDLQLSRFSTAKLQTPGVNSVDVEIVGTRKVFESPELTKTKPRKLHRRHPKSWKHVSKAGVETSCLRTSRLLQKEGQVKKLSGHPQLINPSSIDGRKVRRRKRVFGRISSKNKKVRSAMVGPTIAKEPGQQSFESTTLFEACPLRKKTESWDLKPVISECGRILVPHGSVYFADGIKALKDKVQSREDEMCPPKMLVDGSLIVQDAVEMEQESSTLDETEGGEDHPQNVDVSHVNPDHSALRQSDDGNGSSILNLEGSEQSLKYNGTDTTPLKTDQEKHTLTPSPEKCSKKAEILLNKLKSVLLRGKRKMCGLVPEEKTDTAQDTEPCLKNCKIDSLSGSSSIAVTCAPDPSLAVKEDPKMLSVDPVFAYALGLTPKEAPDVGHVSEDQDTQQRKGTSQRQEQSFRDDAPRIIQSPPSIFPRRRMKTLRKHQDLSAENVKKNWWLHFQTPACFPSKKTQNKECIRNNTVRKTLKEKSTSASSSTDALTLLADLALSASNDQVPPQPDVALERKPETSLEECDRTKDVTSADQESVLHALLRLPAARTLQPPEPPSSPNHLVGGSELVGLLSIEHAYSLPPSSSLLLDLSGSSFQVSPLSGSTRLLHQCQPMHGDGIKTLQPPVNQEDRRKHNHRTPKSLKKPGGKIRHSRTFIIKDGSVQVTKQWKENYDFTQDSKFASDPKHRTVIRALHGPWDSSLQNTNEEVRLIVNMWIGLFYSRSTARSFDLDSNCTGACSEENDSLEIFSGLLAAPVRSEFNGSSFAACLNVKDTSATLISKALDLSKKDNSVLDQGSGILDLSQRISSAEIGTSDPQVGQKETAVLGEQEEAGERLDTLNPSIGPQKCYGSGVESKKINSKVNDVRNFHESKRTCTPLQKANCREHTDVPSLKDGRKFISVQEEMKNEMSAPQENHQTAPRTRLMFHGCNNEKMNMKESEATQMSLVQKTKRDSSRSLKDKKIDSNKEEADDHLSVHDEAESKDAKIMAAKEKKPFLESNMEVTPKTIHTVNSSTTEESLVVWNGHCLENEEQPSLEKSEAVSPCKVESQDKLMADGHFKNEDGFTEKDHSMSQRGTGLDDQPTVKKDYHAPLEKQLPGADNKDACCDLQLRKLMTGGSALTDEHAISEEAAHTPSKKIDNESKVVGNLDLLNQPLPLCDSPDSVKDCTTGCNGQAPLEEQPLQADNKEGACHDLRFLSKSKLRASGQALTDEHAFSGKVPSTLSEMELICNEPEVEKSKAHYQKVPLPMSDDSICSLDCSSASGSILQINNLIQTESHDRVMADINLSNDDHEDRDTKSVEAEQNVDNTPEKGLSPCNEAFKSCEAEVELTKKTDLKRDKSNKGLEKTHNRTTIPLIETDTSAEDALLLPDSHSEDKVEEVQGQKEISLISATTFPETVPTEVDCTSQVNAEMSADKISLGGTDQPLVSGTEADERCPTPTVDEEPCQYIVCNGQSSSSSSAFSGSQPCKNRPQTCLNRSSMLQNERTHKSTIKIDPNPHHPDVELKTLKVVQITNQFLSKPSQTDESNQSKTADMKHSFDQTDILQETSAGHDYCQPYRSFPSVESLEASKTNNDQDGHKTTSQTNGSHDPNLHSQRPVLAVKPSKSDEIQQDCISKDRGIENSEMSIFSKIPIVTHATQVPMPLEKSAESLTGTSVGLNDVKQETMEIDDSLFLGPETSLTCTVFNTSQNTSDSLLEKLSRRCLQDDRTRASMDQECLIFSEQMKQLLKRSKRRPTHQLDTCDTLNLSCSSPVTVHFSSLEEQEDSEDHLDALPMVGAKIRVDVSKKKDLEDTKEEGGTLSQETGNPVEHAGLSSVTAECSRMYTAMMDDVCAVKKVPLRPEHFKMDKGHQRTEPSNHFDSFDQMKKEMDERFHTNLNSVVKRSCKTKYRFYILVTSDDAFFDETKTQLEAEGHTAVQPSEFFLCEDSSSSLFIILRNEDIAEHICEVPHLLKLRKWPGVQFAGVDEPDDVLNLTHQELFMRGGFIMLDTAALESLSICDMKKMSEILHELSKRGKWKWMLHYRDSRRLKENARFSAETKEKKLFLNWCQEAGILEVLPYHECDLMSREQPDYLTCLVRLQVQNISARYPVFITDTTTDNSFGTSGILTMSLRSILTCSPNKTFT